MKDTKQRLFEVMERVNPDFVNEAGVINKVTNVAKTGFNTLNRGAQAVSNKISPAFTSVEDLKHKKMMKSVGAMTQNFRLETFGDLMKMVNVLKQFKTGKIDASAEIAGVSIRFILGLLPGGGSMVSTLEGGELAINLFAKFFALPDQKKTRLWLDKLNLDDELSKIVDDTVESGFFNYLIAKFQSEDPNKKLPEDWNVNKELIDYLDKKYGGRTFKDVPPK